MRLAYASNSREEHRNQHLKHSVYCAAISLQLASSTASDTAAAGAFRKAALWIRMLAANGVCVSTSADAVQHYSRK